MTKQQTVIFDALVAEYQSKGRYTFDDVRAIVETNNLDVKNWMSVRNAFATFNANYNFVRDNSDLNNEVYIAV